MEGRRGTGFWCRRGILAQDSFKIAPVVEATPAPRPGLPGRRAGGRRLRAGLVPGPARCGPARQGIRRRWKAATYLRRAAIQVRIGAEYMVWDPRAPLPPGPPMPRRARPLFPARPRLGRGTHEPAATASLWSTRRDDGRNTACE